MVSVTSFPFAVLLLTLLSPLARAEVFSDLADIVSPPPSVESKALESKADAFWKVVLSAADEMKMSEHLKLYEDTEKAIAALPAENTYVREALTDVLARLKRADAMVLKQGVQSSSVASEQLGAALQGESIFSFFTGGQNFLTQALRRFVNGGEYQDKLSAQVYQRQADILPVLRGAADSTSNVLADSRFASKRSFDVLKYDIYNKGVPKTPQAAKDVANRLVDATGETRHRFMSFITQTVNGISKDFLGKNDGAAATSAQSSLHEALARAEAADRSHKTIVDI